MAGIEDGDTDKLPCSAGRAQLWSFLAARLNLGRGRSSILLSLLAAFLQLSSLLKQREGGCLPLDKPSTS